MKILYLDLGMGAAGDMLSAALLELLPDKEAFIEKLNSLGIPGVRYEVQTATKCGINGTRVKVLVNGEEESCADHHSHENVHEHHHDHNEYSDHDLDHEHHHSHDHEYSHHINNDSIRCGQIHEQEKHHAHCQEAEHCYEYNHDHDEHDHAHEHTHTHHHSSMHDIEHIIYDHINMPDSVKKDVMEVYKLIAEAESHAHGRPVSEIHFHEVGTMDAIADITAVCMLMKELSPDKVYASPVHVGSGHVHCAHGILPVPAPATAYILKDVPVYGGRIEGELCTPTGAALLKHFVSDFGDMPVMRIASIGYGMGKKDFPTANCVRAMLGESEDEQNDIIELSCNVDDMTGEKVGFAIERLFDDGALDVYTVSIGMKKSRPGLLIRVICHEWQREALVRAIFKYTSTIGIREQRMHRYALHRDIEILDTEYGNIRKKIASGYGVKRTKLEYEDVANAAIRKGCSITDIEDKLMSETSVHKNNL